MDNWLINLLALILLAVVVDGARRAYLKHRDTVKVSRNLTRSMRRDLDDRDEDILSAPRSAHTPSRTATPAAEQRTASKSSARGAAKLADSELEYIDPEEAEKRRQISAELPGSVRVVQRRKPEDATQVNRKVQQNFQSSRKPLAGSKPERREEEPATVDAGVRPSVPEQASLNLEEQVPMLMDSIADAPLERDSEQPREPSSAEADAGEPMVEVTGPETTLPEELVVSDRREPSLDETVSLESLQTIPETDEYTGTEAAPSERGNTASAGWSASDIKFPELKFPDLKKAVTPSRETREKKRAGSATGSGDRTNTRGASRKERDVEEVLILNIMAPAGDCFEGNDLLRVLLSSGLRFGEMNIFHYHCGEAGEGPVLFSLANVVVPGTFDMSEMEEFTTPGISLFLALPAEVEALKALDTLLTTARYIAEQLGGELKDENRSVFTAQTAEHYRQRVMEFQRRKALARAQA
ncbi:cell division protein ZipA [Microbulbifer salipaludis]|uniref:Cell division protein ZipA n=1 Tax=Microbulbifer salipaludis TaxID=187980 RepID=A0ABS3E9J6_9GAMM|nr:cell division protein ZipA [Microbulbifer salipaludis]MBN8431957.1 cell division protein ZipA [Microbulbifer salipaludis]